MKNISRRKFVKGALAALALLPIVKTIEAVPIMQDKVVLTVDKDGNATLHDTMLTVDKKNNATVK